jgi:hypothetical protein
MAKNKRPGGRGDRHKPRRMIGLPERLAVQLDKLAERNASRMTQEVIRAVREYLERNNLWPPPAGEKGGRQ